jgi:hypothetical protein
MIKNLTVSGEGKEEVDRKRGSGRKFLEFTKFLFLPGAPVFS